MAESKFVPGARVAVKIGARFNSRCDYREAFVDKVYKNGNFVLRDSSQQWRAWADGKSAVRTGGRHWDSQTAFIWDEGTDEEIRITQVKRERERRFYDACKKIELIAPSQISLELVVALETALTYV